jgi:hypothetical protein
MHPDIRILQERLGQLEAECRQSRADYRRLAVRLRVLGGLGVASLMVALFASPATRAVAQSGYGATLAQLLTRMAVVEGRVTAVEDRATSLDGRAGVLETQTQFISVDGSGEMHIAGTNLHVENGLGATNGNPADPFNPAAAVVNGKGNLILGYNASRVPFAGTDLRTGSHNLILGDQGNYSAYGGLVAGQFNTLSAPYASVSGGYKSTASGFCSSVSGGAANTASNTYASVSGGNSNTASGYISAVSGGFFNAASNTYASVSGGGGNTAGGDTSSVSGGYFNKALGFSTSVSGGYNHAQNGQNIWQGGMLSSGP